MRILLALLFTISAAFGQLALRDAQYYEPSGSFKNPSFIEGLSGWNKQGECAVDLPLPPLSPRKNVVEVSCQEDLMTGDGEDLVFSQTVDTFKGEKGMLLETYVKVDNQLASADSAKVVLKTDNEVIWEQDLLEGESTYPYLFINREEKDLQFGVEVVNAKGTIFVSEMNIKKSFINDNAVESRLSPNTAWQPFTPTVNYITSIGNGVLGGFWRRDGSDMVVYITLEEGSTTAFKSKTVLGISLTQVLSNLTVHKELVKQHTNIYNWNIIESSCYTGEGTTGANRYLCSTMYNNVDNRIEFANHNIAGVHIDSNRPHNWKTGKAWLWTVFRLPIKEWQPSTRAITTKHDYADPTNHDRLDVKSINTSGVITFPTGEFEWLKDCSYDGSKMQCTVTAPVKEDMACTAASQDLGSQVSAAMSGDQLYLYTTEFATSNNINANILNLSCRKVGKDKMDVWSPLKVSELKLDDEIIRQAAREKIDELGIEQVLNPFLSGTASFNGTTDNVITMPGIVTALRLEVGDVIKFEGSITPNNEKLRTVETIVDDDTIRVNWEHAGNRGNGSLKLDDEVDKEVLVRRVVKWYAAPLGLGQEWVWLESYRDVFTETYTNTTGRAISVTVSINSGPTPTNRTHAIYFFVNNAYILHTESRNYTMDTHNGSGATITVPAGSNYAVRGLQDRTGLNIWSELR